MAVMEDERDEGTHEYQVRVDARAEAYVTVQARSEEEALQLAEADGFERTDYFELSDFTAISAEKQQG